MKKFTQRQIGQVEGYALAITRAMDTMDNSGAYQILEAAFKEIPPDEFEKYAEEDWRIWGEYDFFEEVLASAKG